jgi:bacterioferritin-associated ferredoxin
MTVARDLERIDPASHALRAKPAKCKQTRAARFGSAMTRIGNVGDGAIASLASDVTMCQCERLSRATLDTAIADGCATVNDLKAATRCGMGACGGRLCEDAAARLIALTAGRTRTEVGQATGRPPLRPVDLDALAGEFDYDALPMAAPAPL